MHKIIILDPGSSDPTWGMLDESVIITLTDAQYESLDNEYGQADIRAVMEECNDAGRLTRP